ncbi:YbaB/EbfC family nucleoid-associated protein [Amycolatopsis sp. PS_44_ISF1]|uniref:YbaB/EbfC family nucleoid-associated protein n=1 Tax=Amycolatopsis sp. PS_44_ISF1 TaxID=2974917 RepID=UPI0028DDCD0E|nr:YbaB/EbfC family nucleoid-associated protein [Amycolatopsis sp. PS_44_ISF1]MDT8912076.1 YbaB/EbfC family nucleoid-associated protein [Amycolatopsis sp. PS_44_ISF1]
MAEENSIDPAHLVDDAWALLDKESRKLAELGKHWDEASTTVRAKDHSLEMSFDGRGELVKLVFNTAKYRELPPAQLADVIVETLRRGREQAQQQITELMGAPQIPGLDLDGLATGKVRPDEMIKDLMGPMFETLAGFTADLEKPRPESRKPEERRNG